MNINPYSPHDPWDKSKPYSPKDPNWDNYNQKSKHQPMIPKPITMADLFPRMDRWSIGIEDMLSNLKLIAESKPSYPPYNITKFNNKYEIRVAVAGFTKEELEVTIKEHTLTIKSDSTEFKQGETYPITVGELLHQGIAERDFNINFALAEYIEVNSVVLKDGILTVELEQKLPDELKPKKLEIK